MATDGEKLQNQYYAWIYIIGNSPVSKGGQWLQLWQDHHVDCPDFAARSAGNW